MRPLLQVASLSESFAQVWPQVATAVGAELAWLAAGEPPDPRAAVAVVSAAGAEREAHAEVRRLREQGVPAVAVVGAETDYRVALDAVHAGAADYFALPADLSRMRAWLGERTEHADRHERVAALAAEQRTRFDFSRIVGCSPRLREALDRASRVIPQGAATVLIHGETGTGKDLLAQAIHYNGPRAAEAFVEVNCAALPPNLLEAELFGYEKGAFTDARTAKPGLLEMAHRGTLFLDEIGDLAPDLQGKLLRVLEKKRVRRLGSVRDLDVEVRILAATHVDLAARVRERTFREDLFYRLNVIPIVLPPLRERGDDTLVLAEHFVASFSAAYGMAPPPLTDPIRRALRAHAWPGNVRELRNSIERAVILGGGELREDDLFPGGAHDAVAGAGVIPFPARMHDIQRAAARAMVELCEGNKSRAAERLGLSRKGLYSLLAGEERG
jgi:DNA-binding NtrC family response regulator